ncbi:hypothetical protein ABPG74_000021 [Tetrahymena malaccensis]
MNDKPQILFSLADYFNLEYTGTCFNQKFCSLVDFAPTFCFLAFARNKNLFLADSTWINYRLGVNGQKQKKGKLFKLEISSDENKRGSEAINFVKFSPNERLLAVCNDNSIKIFELKTLISDNQTYFSEFETVTNSNSIQYIEFSSFQDTAFSPSKNTMLIYIDDKGALWLCIVILESQKLIQKEGVLAACFSCSENNSQLFYIDSQNNFIVLDIQISDNGAASWSQSSKHQFRGFLKNDEFIKFLKQLSECVFLVAGLNLQQNYKWVKIVRFFKQVGGERVVGEFQILQNSKFPLDINQFKELAFTVTSSRDGMFHYITDSYSSSVDLIYAIDQDKLEFNLAKSLNNTECQFPLPCSQSLRKQDATMKGVCLIETRIDEEPYLNNEEIGPSLILFTNMYSLGRVLVKNLLLRQNTLQKKLQFNEGDDLYSNVDEERRKVNDRDSFEDTQNSRNFSKTQDHNRKMFNIKSSLKGKQSDSNNNINMNVNIEDQIAQNEQIGFQNNNNNQQFLIGQTQIQPGQQISNFSGFSSNQNFQQQESQNISNQMSQNIFANRQNQQQPQSQQQTSLNIFQKNQQNGLPGININQKQENAEMVNNMGNLPQPKNLNNNLNLNIFQQNELKQKQIQEQQMQQVKIQQNQQQNTVQVNIFGNKNQQSNQQSQIKINQNTDNIFQNKSLQNQQNSNERNSGANIFGYKTNNSNQQNIADQQNQSQIFNQNNQISSGQQQLSQQPSQTNSLSSQEKQQQLNVTSLFAAPQKQSQQSQSQSTINLFGNSQKQNPQLQKLNQISSKSSLFQGIQNNQQTLNNQKEQQQFQNNYQQPSYYEEYTEENQQQIQQTQLNILNQKTINMVRQNPLNPIKEETQLSQSQEMNSTGQKNKQNIFQNQTQQIQGQNIAQIPLPDLKLQKQITFGINNTTEQQIDNTNNLQQQSNQQQTQQITKNQNQQTGLQQNMTQQLTQQQQQQQQHSIFQNNNQNNLGQQSIFETQSKISLLNNQNPTISLQNNNNKQKNQAQQQDFSQYDKITVQKFKIVRWLEKKLDYLKNIDNTKIFPVTGPLLQTVSEINKEYCFVDSDIKLLFENGIQKLEQILLNLVQNLDSPISFYLNIFNYPQSIKHVIKQQQGQYKLDLNQIKYFRNNYKFKTEIFDKKIYLMSCFLNTLEQILESSIKGLRTGDYNQKETQKADSLQIKMYQKLPYQYREKLFIEFLRNKITNKVEEISVVDTDIKRISFDEINQIKRSDLMQQIDFLCLSAIKKGFNFDDDETLFQTTVKKKNQQYFSLFENQSSLYKDFLSSVKSNAKSIQKRENAFDHGISSIKQEKCYEFKQEYEDGGTDIKKEGNTPQKNLQNDKKPNLDFRNLNFDEVSEDEEIDYLQKTKQIKAFKKENDQQTQGRVNKILDFGQEVQISQFEQNESKKEESQQDKKRLIEKKELLSISKFGVDRIQNKQSMQMFNFLKKNSKKNIIQLKYKTQNFYEDYQMKEEDDTEEVNSQDSGYLKEQSEQERDINEFYYFKPCQRSDFSSILLSLDDDPQIKMDRYLNYKLNRYKEAELKYQQKYGQNSQQQLIKNQSMMTLQQKNNSSSIFQNNNQLSSNISNQGQNVLNKTNSQPQLNIQNQQQQQQQQQQPVNIFQKSQNNQANQNQQPTQQIQQQNQQQTNKQVSIQQNTNNNKDENQQGQTSINIFAKQNTSNNNQQNNTNKNNEQINIFKSNNQSLQNNNNTSNLSNQNVNNNNQNANQPQNQQNIFQKTENTSNNQNIFQQNKQANQQNNQAPTQQQVNQPQNNNSVNIFAKNNQNALPQGQSGKEQNQSQQQSNQSINIFKNNSSSNSNNSNNIFSNKQNNSNTNSIFQGQQNNQASNIFQNNNTQQSMNNNQQQSSNKQGQGQVVNIFGQARGIQENNGQQASSQNQVVNNIFNKSLQQNQQANSQGGGNIFQNNQNQNNNIFQNRQNNLNIQNNQSNNIFQNNSSNNQVNQNNNNYQNNQNSNMMQNNQNNTNNLFQNNQNSIQNNQNNNLFQNNPNYNNINIQNNQNNSNIFKNSNSMVLNNQNNNNFQNNNTFQNNQNNNQNLVSKNNIFAPKIINNNNQEQNSNMGEQNNRMDHNSKDPSQAAKIIQEIYQNQPSDKPLTNEEYYRQFSQKYNQQNERSIPQSNEQISEFEKQINQFKQNTNGQSSSFLQQTSFQQQVHARPSLNAQLRASLIKQKMNQTKNMT